MLNREIIVNRLALIKYLYKIGLEQSGQVETIAAFSILSFHDSIEMFLKLVAENNNLKSDNFNFLDYWTHFPSLTLKESMRNVNARRVNIKHKGLLPSKSDIEITRVNTTDFFEQNVILQLGIDFKDVSLLNLINNENVRTHLEASQKALNENEIQTCIQESAIAFNELLISYENNKLNYFGESPFFIGKDLHSIDSLFSPFKDEKKMHEFSRKIKDSIIEIQKAIKIISFGIDYKRYVKFKVLTPEVEYIWGGHQVFDIRGKKIWTIANCQYCIDFVMDCSLKLQEFDFGIHELEESI